MSELPIKKKLLMTPVAELFKDRPAGPNPEMTLAAQQWSNLRNALSSAGADVIVLPSDDNAKHTIDLAGQIGFLYKNRLLPSYSKYDSLMGQFSSSFDLLHKRGIEIVSHGVQDRSTFHFSGSDAIFDKDNKAVFLGVGFNTTENAVAAVDSFLGNVLEGKGMLVCLKLVNPIWNNLDSCFCPLGNGWAIWYPGAFDNVSQYLVKAIYGDKLIEIGAQEAFHSLSTSSIVVGDFIITPLISDKTRDALIGAGLTPLQVKTDTMFSIGGPKRLILEMIE